MRLAMLESKVFFILILAIVASVSATPPMSDDLMFTPEIIELANEFVRLHLVEELIHAGKMAKTTTGRDWLYAWESKKNFIMSKVFLQKKKRYWNPNWRERMQNFQELQTLYLDTLVKDYDVRRENSPWPKITFNPAISKTIIHKNEEKRVTEDEHYLADPLVSDDEIARVMHLHRPFTDDELKARMTKSQSKIMSETESHDLKRYYIINPDPIKKLLKARYELTFQNLKGKRSSDLDYQARLFIGERIVDQLKLWEKEKFHRRIDPKDEYFFAKFPRDFQVLSYDEVYREFLNIDDRFFEGNTFYGYKNRYDDPAKHGFDFDVTAENIIGSRYRQLGELAEDVRSFKQSSNHFTRYDIIDLPVIDMCIERFKSLNFWYPYKPFVEKQWFSMKDPVFQKGEMIYMPKPNKNYKSSRSEENMFKFLKNVIDLAKKYHDYDYKAESMIRNSKRFQLQLTMDILMMNNNIGKAKIRQSVWSSQVSHYMTSLNKANLLQSLELMVPLSGLSISLLSKNKRRKQRKILTSENEVKNSDVKSENFIKIHDMDGSQYEDLDKLESEVFDLFDPEKNTMMDNNGKKQPWERKNRKEETYFNPEAGTSGNLFLLNEHDKLSHGGDGNNNGNQLKHHIPNDNNVNIKRRKHL